MWSRIDQKTCLKAITAAGKLRLGAVDALHCPALPCLAGRKQAAGQRAFSGRFWLGCAREWNGTTLRVGHAQPHQNLRAFWNN